MTADGAAVGRVSVAGPTGPRRTPPRRRRDAGGRRGGRRDAVGSAPRRVRSWCRPGAAGAGVPALGSVAPRRARGRRRASARRRWWRPGRRPACRSRSAVPVVGRVGAPVATAAVAGPWRRRRRPGGVDGRRRWPRARRPRPAPRRSATGSTARKPATCGSDRLRRSGTVGRLPTAVRVARRRARSSGSSPGTSSAPWPRRRRRRDAGGRDRAAPVPGLLAAWPDEQLGHQRRERLAPTPRRRGPSAPAPSPAPAGTGSGRGITVMLRSPSSTSRSGRSSGSPGTAGCRRSGAPRPGRRCTPRARGRCGRSG